MEIREEQIGEFRLDGERVPYVNLVNERQISAVLRVGKREYGFLRSFPIAGNSGAMPETIGDLRKEGRSVLIAERDGRYLL